MPPTHNGKARVFAHEAHLRSILETVPDAMIVIDEHGDILSFSAAAERMFGYREEELLGRNVSMLMPSPDKDRHNSYIEAYLRTGVRKVLSMGRVTTACRRDGTSFSIDAHIGEARLGAERVFTGFIRDLTEGQQTELRLHELQSKLAHVSRVTAMGTLATSIAHELNQPLTAIANYVQTVRDMLETPGGADLAAMREALDECADQSIRAGQIIRRTRDLASHGEAERHAESLSRIVGEASALALVGTGERGVEVQVRLDSSIDMVMVDRIQLQQVVFNLLRNAIEAMADSPVRRIEISSSRGHRGEVCVTIADSGPGLDPDIAAQLFRPFVSSKDKGMGLGLAICHAIIDSHGGGIWADSPPAGGTAFHFTIIGAAESHDG